MKKRVLSLLLAVMMVFTVLPAASFAASASDFTIENGVLTKYNGTGGNVVIPDSVTSIGYGAFARCSSLTSVTIPNSVTSIGSWAFGKCSSLTSVTIPDSVTAIGFSTFRKCSSLTSVTIPNSVTSIGNYAFEGCSSLTSVTIPDSVTSIGDDTFCGCSSLTSVTIPDSVTAIGWGAFNGCSSLTSVTIPNSVTTIGGESFENCSSLTSVVIPNSVTEIGVAAFKDCTGLTSITIPDSVTDIAGEAFQNTPWLEEQGAFATVNGVLLRYQGTDAVVTIPDSVTSIGMRAFECYQSTGFVTSVIIPNSMTSIGERAFEGAMSLISITIPDSVTSIGFKAFWFCSHLTTVTIPSSVASIEDSAFEYCGSLTDVYYGGSEEQWKSIEINKEENYFLLNATIHYNATMPTITPPATATATPTGNTLLVDGAEKLPAAYMINDNNYFKLRDVAALLNGTKAQFSIGWDGVTGAITITTGEAYTAVGGELAGKPTDVSTAQSSQSTVYINGQKADLTAYLINDNNYFKLRDLGKALGFNVSWDGVKGAVLIESDKPYSDAN